VVPGFLGQHLARQLLALPALPWAGGRRSPLAELLLADLVAPPPACLADPRVRVVVGEIGMSSGALSLTGVDAVVHLAAAVSGDCEADLDLGLRSNLQASLALLQAARAYGTRAAVRGGQLGGGVWRRAGQPLPPVVADLSLPTPQDYGIQKFMVEQLVADLQPAPPGAGAQCAVDDRGGAAGRANGAASSFLSGMVREPWRPGVRVPVPPEMPVALASPGRTVQGLLCALQASEPQAWGALTALNLPALTTTVGDIAAALARLAGPAASALLDWQPDARIAAIVGGWPSRFDAARARALGLLPDPSIDAILRDYVPDHRGHPAAAAETP